MSKKNLPKINPCPFCHGKRQYTQLTFMREWVVICKRESCKAQGPPRLTPLGAITAWNKAKRLSPPIPHIKPQHFTKMKGLSLWALPAFSATPKTL